MKHQKALAVVTVSILLVSFAPLFASVIITTKTTTVSGPCTGTATLDDGSPSGLTTTYVSQCTGTITYQSTTTTTTSSTTLVPEAIYHINGGAGCPTLGILSNVNSLRSNFIASYGNAPGWKINFYMSSKQSGVLAINSLYNYNNGSHMWQQLVYVNGTKIQNFTATAVDLNGKVLIGTLSTGYDIDFYNDGGGGQGFIYSPAQTAIDSAINMPNFLNNATMSSFTGSGSDLNFSDMARNVTPIGSTNFITFSNPLNLNIQEGQQFELPRPAANIPLFAQVQDNTPNPCSLVNPVAPMTNAVETLVNTGFQPQGSKNDQTMYELQMALP